MTTPFPAQHAYLTLAEIDAAIATYTDPLTPDEVVALAQWWTLRHLRRDMGGYISLEELRLLCQAGRGAEAVQTVLQCFASEEDLVSRLSAIYEALPRRDAHLLRRIYNLVAATMQTAQQAGKSPPEHMLRLLTELEVRCGRYEVALQFARSSLSTYEAAVRQMITHLLETGRHELLDDYVWLLPLFPEKLSLHRLQHLKMVISEAVQLGENAVAEKYLVHLRCFFTAIEQVYGGIPQVEGEDVLPNAQPQTYMRAAEIYSHCLILTGRLTEARACLSRLPATVDPAQLLSAVQIACKRTMPVYDVISFWEGLPDELKQGLMAVVMIGWLVELGAADTARQALQTLAKDPFLYPALLPALYQLGDDETVRQFIITYAQPAAQRADRKIGEWIRALIASGKLDEAARLAALVPHVSRFHYYGEIATAALRTRSVRAVAMQVQCWLYDAEPATSDASQWEWGYFMLAHHFAQALAPLDRDLAFVWAVEASFRLKNLHAHSQYYTYIPGHITTLLTVGDEPSARIWTEQLAHLPVMLRVHVLGGQQLIAQGDRATAAVWLVRLFAARSHLLGKAWQPVLQWRDAMLAADTPAGFTLFPNDLRQSLDRHKLTQPDNIAHSWQNKQVAASAFVGALYLSAPVLNILAPDLYQRTLRACLDIVAQHAPAWLDTLTEPEGAAV
jgi:hypothetical protein